MARAWRTSPALAAAACALLTACPPARSPDDGPAVGVSDKPRAARRPSTPPTTSAPTKEPPDLRAGTAPVGAQRPSLGHAGGRWDYRLSANDAGRAALTATSPTAEAAVGAKLVMDHFERSDGAKGPTMAMEKKPKGYDPAHGDWRWVIVGSSGALLFDGKTERCWGCHDDAPHDRVFPQPE